MCVRDVIIAKVKQQQQGALERVALKLNCDNFFFLIFAAHLVYNYNNNKKSNPFHFGLHCTVARLSAHISLSNPIEPFLKWEMLKTNITTRRMLATGEGGVDVSCVMDRVCVCVGAPTNGWPGKVDAEIRFYFPFRSSRERASQTMSTRSRRRHVMR